jgi:hypothetical protein
MSKNSFVRLKSAELGINNSSYKLCRSVNHQLKLIYKKKFKIATFYTITVKKR